MFGKVATFGGIISIYSRDKSRGIAPTGRIKKYFYAIRPILACMWIEKYGGSPPMEFEQLLKLIESNRHLYSRITELLVRKREGVEFDREKRIDEINNFIEMKFNYFDSIASEYGKQQKPDEEYLNSIFRYLLHV